MKKITTILSFLIITNLSFAGAGHDHSSHAGHDHSSHAGHDQSSHADLHGKSLPELIDLAYETTSQILVAASPEIMHETVQLLGEITSELQQVITHTELEQKQRALGMSNNLQKSVKRLQSAMHQEKLDQLPGLTKTAKQMLAMLKTYIPEDCSTQTPHDHSGHNH